LEHNDRDGGSLAEAGGQRNRASVALGSPGECALRWANVLSLDAGVGCSFSAGAAVALSDNEEWSPLWSPLVATGGNQWQIGGAASRRIGRRVGSDQRLQAMILGAGSSPTFLTPRTKTEGP